MVGYECFQKHKDLVGDSIIICYSHIIGFAMPALPMSIPVHFAANCALM